MEHTTRDRRYAIGDKQEDSMSRVIDREEVRRLLEAGAQLVDVLSLKEYERAHLPGAIHIPLKVLGQETPARIRMDTPVITYCYDLQ